jgi:hypothetical protein
MWFSNRFIAALPDDVATPISKAHAGGHPTTALSS